MDRTLTTLALTVALAHSCASPMRVRDAHHTPARAPLPETAALPATAALPETRWPAVLGTHTSHTTFGLTLENDFFTGSDDNYSNGLALSCLSGPVGDAPAESFQRRWTDFWSFLPFIDEDDRQTFVGWTIGQEMFTPDDISLANPPLDDQPYAGVLLIDFTFYGKSPLACHAWRLRTGFVGPHTAADDLQTSIHELIDDEKPMGWSTQLPDEPILNLDYAAAFGLLASESDRDFAWRLVPACTASAGTYFTGAGGALYGEFGYNLGDTIGLLSLRQGIDPVSLVVAAGETEPSLNVHVGAGGLAVGHYLPLDGTVFRDSRSVDSEPLVGFFSWGLALRWGAFSASYVLSYFTDQFETQRNPPEFGNLTLTWEL